MKRSKLKPAVVFDIDDTLVELAEGWGPGTVPSSEALIHSMSFHSTVFLHDAISEKISRYPRGGAYAELNVGPEDPSRIFFITARPEGVREDTVHNLSIVLGRSGTDISSRLLMRPDKSDTIMWSQHETKTYLIKRLRERGYYPMFVFDNCPGAIQAYIESGAEAAFLSLMCTRDKEDFCKGNLI